MANRLPDWTVARLLPHSILQQFLNPTGSATEDLYKYIITQTRNQFVTAANLDQLDVVNTIRLPNDFVFGKYLNNLYSNTYVAPQICGYINSIDIWPTVVDNLDDFWNEALPTRITATGRQRYAGPVLDEVTISDLEDAVPNAITHPTRLAVIVTGCVNFVDLSRRAQGSILVLYGTTERDLEETEVMLIPYNGTFITNKIWKSLDRVEYYGLQPSTGTVKINNFCFNIEREVDKYQLSVAPDQEKLVYHKLGSHTFDEGDFSTHQLTTLIANNLGELYSGVDTLEAVHEIELLYNDNNINLIDIAVQPFTGRIFGLSTQYLYIFDQYAPLPDYREMHERTTGAAVSLHSDFYSYLRGDTARVEAVWSRQLKRILKNRWSVLKPDGNTIYLDIEGNEVSNTAAWIFNTLYSELAFGPFESDGGLIDKQVMSYTLSQRGTYLFKIETVFADNSQEVDILPLYTEYKEALTRLVLPTALQDGEGIAFDSNQKLWVLRAVGGSNPYDVPYEYGIEYNIYGVAIEANLATDTALVDFTNKIIYLHEEYDSLEITESEDWVVER